MSLDNMHFTSTMKSLLFNACSLLFLVTFSSATKLEEKINRTGPLFPAVIAFGDSILDTGNNNLLPTVAKCDFPPYGQDFIDHEATGRFCNGKVPSDFLVSKLGIKEVLPAYLSPKLRNEDLATGVCFASGSSGYDHITSDILSVISIQDQLDLFKEYKDKLQAATDPGTAENIIKDSLYVVCTGSNDFANTYFTTPIRKAFYDIPSYAIFLLDSGSEFLQDLYDLGARKIAVVGLPPLGCLPSQRTLAGGFQRDCITSYNDAAKLYNEELKKKVKVLQKKLAGSTIIYADIYDKLLHIIQNPSEYGFNESTKGCCGSGMLEAGPLCNRRSSVCDDDRKYVFWDSFHPTEKTYEILVDEIIEEDLPLLL